MKTLVSDCPIEGVMQVLSGRWPSLLLYYLQEGTKRFSELRRDNPELSHRILSLELRKLEQAGLVALTAFEGYPSRVEYDLTPSGAQIMPMIDQLADWWEASAVERQRQTAPARAG
ncbi:MAG: helix-turn-helix domain-containing protein [Devosia sp.]